MTKRLLDPWNDAARIAAYLEDAGTRLIIGLGAEWCSRCESIQPQFATLARTPAHAEHWLWLNLEEHSELLGEFMPETLPLLWVYQGSQLIRYGSPIALDNPDSTAAFLHGITPLTPAPDTNIRACLTKPDWAP